jgi:DNA processing protein
MHLPEPFHFIAHYSPLYPSLLGETHHAPIALYARGNLALLQTPCFAIVGTRNTTTYGRANAVAFTKGLLDYGLTIVSGLAYGIDEQVHEATLHHGGKTIAVLGCGLDKVSGPGGLAREILKRDGLLLSEYPPQEVAYKNHFPARNRIISGLSIGTLVVEAPEKSGALITARRAFEQNRQVFAVPGDLMRETFVGSHTLIANDIARLVRTPEDIAYHLNLTASALPFLPLPGL